MWLANPNSRTKQRALALPNFMTPLEFFNVPFEIGHYLIAKHNHV